MKQALADKVMFLRQHPIASPTTAEESPEIVPEKKKAKKEKSPFSPDEDIEAEMMEQSGGNS